MHASYPTPAHVVRAEPMNDHFLKLHLGDGPRLLHRFVQAEPDEHLHNHPWSFTSHVLSGGYEEEVVAPQPDGTYAVVTYVRRPGTSHRVKAGTIHRLVRLLSSEAWTLVEPGPWEQKSGFYRLDDANQLWHWFWDERPEAARSFAPETDDKSS